MNQPSETSDRLASRALAAYYRSPLLHTGIVGAVEVRVDNLTYVVVRDDAKVLKVYRHREDTDKLRLLKRWPAELDQHTRKEPIPTTKWVKLHPGGAETPGEFQGEDWVQTGEVHLADITDK